MPLLFSGEVAAQEDGCDRGRKEGREMRLFSSGACLISRTRDGGGSTERHRSESVSVETLSRCGGCGKSRGRGLLISANGASRGKVVGILFRGDKDSCSRLGEFGALSCSVAFGFGTSFFLGSTESGKFDFVGSIGVGLLGIPLALILITSAPKPSHDSFSVGPRGDPTVQKQSTKGLSRSKAATSGRPASRKLISTESVKRV